MLHYLQSLQLPKQNTKGEVKARFIRHNAQSLSPHSLCLLVHICMEHSNTRVHEYSEDMTYQLSCVIHDVFPLCSY